MMLEGDSFQRGVEPQIEGVPAPFAIGPIPRGGGQNRGPRGVLLPPPRETPARLGGQFFSPSENWSV